MLTMRSETWRKLGEVGVGKRTDNVCALWVPSCDRRMNEKALNVVMAQVQDPDICHENSKSSLGNS